MLVAEIHGKRVTEAQNSEDYLTSAVFGQLRWIPPNVFWESLFSRARDATPDEGRLTHTVSPLNEYETMTADFWPRFKDVGEPDMILKFSGPDRPELRIIIEVKLWSEKSGREEYDQLARYLGLLDTELKPPSCLVYLTPRNAEAEINESLKARPGLEAYRQRLFMLQWQELLEAAEEAVRTRGLAAQHRTILSEVAEFLKRRELSFFDGYRQLAGLPLLPNGFGGFYDASTAYGTHFDGMQQVVPLETITVERGAWIQ